MTLKETVAQYVIERDSLLDELHPFAKDYPGTSIAWHRERDRRSLDTAVRNVALAVSWQRHDYMHSEVKAQLGRLLPEGNKA